MNNKIPICIPLEDDELLFSWVYRIYKANLFDDMKGFEKTFNKCQSIYRDGFGLCRDIVLSSTYEDKLREFFIKSTLYSFFAPFYKLQKQEKVLSVARHGVSSGSPLSYLGCEVKKLRYCPKCVEEDSILHLHRSHQLPGVKVCYKHGCELLELDKKYKSDDMENISFDEKPSYTHTDLDMKHAIFVKGFMDEAFDLDFDGLIKILKIRLDELNIKTPKDVEKFFSNKDLPISKTNVRNLAFSPQKLSEDFLERNLVVFFECIENFKRIYKEVFEKEKEETSPQRLKIKGYELVGPYKKNLLEIRHKGCGKSFLITEYGLLDIGFRCPDCTKLTDKEAYEQIFHGLFKGEFTLLSPYEGPNKKVKIKHSCGHEFEAEANDFYYSGLGCPLCRARLSKEEAQAKVDLVDPTFKLLDYSTVDSQATFLHETCGKTVKRRFNDFLRKGMSCPHCLEEKLKSKTPLFKKWMEDLVGTEYELIGDYMGDRRPVKIRHKPCGLVTKYPRATYFLDGQRCPLCHGTISREDVKAYVSARSKGAFLVMNFLPESHLEVLNTTTNEAYTLKKKLVLQELARPTESEILPCSTDENIERPISTGGKFFKQIQELYSDKIFQVKDMMSLGLPKKTLKRFISLGLVKKHEEGYKLVQEIESEETKR